MSEAVGGVAGENNLRRYIETGKNGRVTGFRTDKFQYSTLGRLILFRLLNDRDIKIIITSSGSTTGTGKTTLAIHLCRWIRQVANELFDANRTWNAEDGSMVDLYDYFKGYQNAAPGDPLLLDEIEYSADRRRAMSNENVKLSQAWSILRYKNVATVSTLPSVSMLEWRLMELGDVWINVVEPGRANPYYLTVDDFDHQVIRKRLKQKGYRETVMWDKLTDDPDYETLKTEKEELGIPGLDDTDHVTREDVNQKEREVRREVTLNILERLESDDPIETQTDVGEVVNYSQPNVAKLKREYLA